jgi:hypothetical protein
MQYADDSGACYLIAGCGTMAYRVLRADGDGGRLQIDTKHPVPMPNEGRAP